MIHGVDCDVTSSSYQEIVCITKNSGYSIEPGDRTFPVDVLVKKTADGGLPVECSRSCDFSYTAAATPSVDSIVLPSDVSICACVFYLMSNPIFYLQLR